MCVFKKSIFNLCGLLLVGTATVTYGDNLIDPPVFSSHNKTLNLLMIAKPVTINALPDVTGGWGYEICEIRNANSDFKSCKTPNSNPYGGSRLQLNAGDTLKIHLVNQLPLIPDSKHGLESPTLIQGQGSGETPLLQNPTNVHTHGMLVSPNPTTYPDNTVKYGDNIFVLTFNSSNPALLKTAASTLGSTTDPTLVTPDQITASANIPASMMHGSLSMPVNTDSTDYEIKIPAHHPSGLYWFHPHAHGISLNQITAGLSGIITVGKMDDYVTNLSPISTTIRHLILKDTQINVDKTLNDQLDPGFCGDLTNAIFSTGKCTSHDGDSLDGRSWNFTVNGQLYPHIDVKSLSGEIWRIMNSSGSLTYDLQLTKTTTVDGKETKSGNGMIMQLLAVDGISVTPSSIKSINDTNQIGGAKFVAITCPTAIPNSAKSICVNKLHLMPGVRAEVWVVNRDADGKIINGDGSTAIFETTGYSTGTGNTPGIADDWPPIDLASVTFVSKTLAPPVLKVKDTKHNALGLNTTAIAKDLKDANAKVSSDSTNCKSLPVGWKRRIFFGIDYATTTNGEDFGLGYDLITSDGKLVDSTGTTVNPTLVINGEAVPAQDGSSDLQDVAAFPTAVKSICVPLGAGNTPVNERWELINLAPEDHNFHIHQTKFRVLTDTEIAGGSSVGGILQDSVPVFAGTDGKNADGTAITNGSGCDGSIAKWRSGECVPTRVTVEIPFAITGDFVYHCHILEHEDGGMMSVIHVAGGS